MQRSRRPADAHGESFAVNESPDQDVLVRWSRRSQPAADVDSSKNSNGKVFEGGRAERSDKIEASSREDF